ncbi:glycosyltransferase [Pedobacter glucosidilyticus]|uniref:glycosyltransferase n=1 Tax=Pedobacter glucosidilyticus TaxID=1122941 RepID=UPI0026EC7FC3|nr:hypothetical protein [Pedobacter glucosidilyticus]
MKKILIISPYFPPCNAADMQRIRMSLPYFKEFGWEANVVCVHPDFCEVNKDHLLLEAIPTDIKIYTVKPISKKWTKKIGLGSIAIRSLNAIRKKVDVLLNKEHFDLIYFSTTQFPVCILGNYWKKRFGIPYIIDMQDPWHSDYYINKPKAEQPPKYWFSYRLNKWLEPLAMKHVDGLISVSEAYIKTLQTRYEHIRKVPVKVITFGVFDQDFCIAEKHQFDYPSMIPYKNEDVVNVVYVGRGGLDMKDALVKLFSAFRLGLRQEASLFKNMHFYFLGTSYAPDGQGKQTIFPLAQEMGIAAYVTEQTNRIPFYQTLNTLKSADLLFIAGSNDPQYTASKTYPYMFSKNPLLAIFHQDSSAAKIIRECNAGEVITFDMPEDTAIHQIYTILKTILLKQGKQFTRHESKLNQYSAKNKTAEQCDFFDKVLTASKITI